jgi:hypothetical protein
VNDQDVSKNTSQIREKASNSQSLVKIKTAEMLIGGGVSGLLTFLTSQSGASTFLSLTP